MAEFEVVATGPFCLVAMLTKVAKTFESLDADKRAALLETMSIYANEGSRNIPKTQFTFEARLSTGGHNAKQVAICAFKAWKVRLYGADVRVEQKPAFMCSEIDVAKKQNKGDQDMMARAAKKLAPYV